jgi:hypothetical protein
MGCAHPPFLWDFIDPLLLNLSNRLHYQGVHSVPPIAFIKETDGVKSDVDWLKSQ